MTATAETENLAVIACRPCDPTKIRPEWAPEGMGLREHLPSDFLRKCRDCAIPIWVSALGMATYQDRLQRWRRRLEQPPKLLCFGCWIKMRDSPEVGDWRQVKLHP